MGCGAGEDRATVDHSARGPRTVAAVAAVACLVLLSGCATRADAPGATSASAAPTSTGAASPAQLSTGAPVTVLDDGDGAELCLGGVTLSLPPQCGGPKLVGWDWADWSGSYEEQSAVRWGQFLVVGTYDAQGFAFTPTEVTPWDESTPYVQDGQNARDTFATPCPEPDGGWRVLDPGRTTDQTMEQVFARASQLRGYAASWVDRSRIPPAGPDATPEEQLAETAPYPELTIVNVRVVGDPAAAERELRTVWGGMLCVTAAERTSAELNGVADQVMDELSGSRDHLGTGVDELAGRVSVQIIHDDGSLQTRMDEGYGEGVVFVESALVPAV